jgi:hypothetical protein
MNKATHTESVPAPDDRSTAHPGWWTVLAVLVTAWLGVPLALPLLAAAPWIWFRWRNETHAHRLGPTLRWALAVWITGAAALALAGDRALRTIPFGATSATTAHAWLDGASSAVPSLSAMLVATLLFAVATVASRGVAGAVVLASALLVSDVHSSTVLSRSWNVLTAAPMAIPLWSVLTLAGMTLLLDPLAAWGDSRVWRIRRDESLVSRRRLIIGAALIVAGILARVALAAPLTELARRVTLP